MDKLIVLVLAAHRLFT